MVRDTIELKKCMVIDGLKEKEKSQQILERKRRERISEKDHTKGRG